MSRAYRITLKETAIRDLKGSDEICTDLEILEVLPCEQMGELLKKELTEKGFAEGDDGTYRRTDGNVTITVNPKTFELSVRADVDEEVTLEARRHAGGYDDVGPSERATKAGLQEQLAKDIDAKAHEQTERLRGRASEQLEEKLRDLEPELSEMVNKVTREALKQKAKQLGTIKELHEDEASGSLTITIEV